MVNGLYISVILPLKLEWEPCYSIPETWEGKIYPGDRVKVLFANKVYSGVVSAVGIIPEVDPAKVKDIIEVEEGLARVIPEEIELWRQVAGYYLCSIGEVYKAAYPGSKINLEEARAAALQKAKERREKLLNAMRAKVAKLQDRKTRKEEQLAKVRKGTKAELKYGEELQRIIADMTKAQAALASATGTVAEVAQTGKLTGPMQNELTGAQDTELTCHTSPTSYPTGSQTGPPTISISQPQDINTSQPVNLSQAQSIAYDEIRDAFSKGRPALLKGVTGSGKTEIYIKLAQDALSAGKNVLYLVPEIALSRQLEDRLYEHFGDRLMTFHSAETAASKRVTAEIIRSHRESNGSYIVLGTRSSLFLPHHNLGLIIVDEEHDNSYKQDSPAPRYNGRDTALMLAMIQNRAPQPATGTDAQYAGCTADRPATCKADREVTPNAGPHATGKHACNADREVTPNADPHATGSHACNADRHTTSNTVQHATGKHACNVIMGSATPSLEELYNCRAGKHQLVELNERFHGSEAADVEIIDTRAERRKRGMEGSFSRKLIEHVRRTLAGNGQVMVLRSRRAWAPALQCEACGDIPKCPHCNVSLTYHKKGQYGVMTCHYCGHTEPFKELCGKCGGPMKSLGAGTQKIEEEAAALFPEARIARLDSDTAQNKSYETKTIREFSQGKIDILIGTQMLAKGFDFSNLRLVAVIAADAMLGMQDFRADEKAVQLLEQFRGRCGRRDAKGLCIIQTSQPEHPVYKRLTESEASCDDLLQERHEFDFPPYTRIIEVTFMDRYADRAERMAAKLAAALGTIICKQPAAGHAVCNANGNRARNMAGTAIIGPYSPVIDKVADQHIRTIRISLRKDKRLRSLKEAIRNTVLTFEKNEKYTNHITIDVDPS